MRKLNLHWALGQFNNFRLFGNVSYMREKIRQFEFCIDYMNNNYANITETDLEEIETYKRLVKIYKRRIREAK